ncbi:IPT/TIG domain-containing protein [Nonomuraea sp. B12E4]|uniref:IPT/TIG domain-containing protein n=1 Tax=Nonomuraea sp. B12E4 TaxID=3153564 RepID=UPI00325DC1C1
MPPPLITSLAAGPQGTNQGNSGQTLTIDGAGLTGVTHVNIGARAVPVATPPSEATVTCVLPSGTGMVHVTVTGPNGTSNPLPFYYIARPIMISVAPSWQGAENPSNITVFGHRLLTANQVLIDGVTATLITPTTDSQISVSPDPIPPVGAVPWLQMKDVSIRTAGGTATLPDALTFFDPPSIESLAPDTAFAGTQIQIRGTAFVSQTIRAHFVSGDTQRDGTIVFGSSAQLVVTVPSGLTGTVDVHVDTLGGHSNAVSFTYR